MKRTILKQIPDSYSEELINDISNYLVNYDKDNSDNIKNIKIHHRRELKNIWYSIYRDLVSIFLKHYYIDYDNYDLEKVYRNNIYHDYIFNKKQIKKKSYKLDVIGLYPYIINHALKDDNILSDDGYINYIFNIIYEHIKIKSFTRKFFLNYFFGIINTSNEIPSFNIDINEYIINYCKLLFKDVKRTNCYYRNIDLFYFKNDDVLKSITNELDKRGINYETNICSYLELNDRRVMKEKILKQRLEHEVHG